MINVDIKEMCAYEFIWLWPGIKSSAWLHLIQKSATSQTDLVIININITLDYISVHLADKQP
jgi:hypothetical protein